MGQLLFVASGGAGAGANLQATYDVGPNGLIVTDATGPFGIDNLRFEDEVISSIDGTTGAGSILELSAGNAGTATPISPNGGGVVIGAGDGGDATGGANTAGNGGDVSISAGSAGQGSAGAAQGIAGPVNISGGLGGAGTGGFVSIGSGTGTIASGTLDIATGSSATQVGLLSISGGDAVGSAAPGGDIDIIAGSADSPTDQNGGSVFIGAGNTSEDGVGLGGNVTIQSGTGDQPGELIANRGASTGNMARIYQITIAGTGPYVVDHGLATSFPVVMVWSEGSTTFLATHVVTITQNTTNQVTVAVAPDDLVNAQITVVGF